MRLVSLVRITKLTTKGIKSHAGLSTNGPARLGARDPCCRFRGAGRMSLQHKGMILQPGEVTMPGGAQPNG